MLGSWCVGLRLKESCSVRYKMRACNCSRVRALRSVVEVFASVAAVWFSCWSAMDGVMSMLTMVG